MRLQKRLSMLVAIAAIATIALPSFAYARGSDHKEDNEATHREDRSSHRANINDLGVQIFGDANGHNKMSNDVLGLFYKGMVTAVSGTGFTVLTNNNVTLTVDTTNAKLIRIPKTVITLTDIKVNDKVWISGLKTNTTVSAYVVFDMPENVSRAKAKGTVTAVNGNTVTVQTKNDKTITVTTDADTQVVKADGTTGTSTDVVVGSKVKLWGLWNKVTSIFDALRIKIKA